MKQILLLASCMAFAGVVCLRICCPELGGSVREEANAAILSEEAAAEAFFRDNGGETETPALGQTGESPIQSPLPRELAAEFLQEDSAETLPAECSGDGPEPTPPPEAVAAFLESQSLFSGYELPENVDCGLEELPFAYARPVFGLQSSGFGYRLHPIYETVRFHYGTDMAAYTGDAVSAFADGTVVFSGYDESYGWNLILDHGDGWQTRYAHCSELYVCQGQAVSKGEKIAAVGESGLATGPHLHFELSRDGVYRNPEYYLNG